ncbi:MAG: mechanosensitive ion channel family protein [Negativicutes bacterium]|nr:mechanosensitive ion channel family protein [Negativicutes bacterium]
MHDFIIKVWHDLRDPASLEIILTRGLRLLVIGAVLFAIWALASHLLRRLLSAGRSWGIADRADEKRLATLRGFCQNVIRIVLAIFGLIMGLRELGIDTTSMLAGVSVVGLAIGVGAQHMVRDYLSGIIIVVENQFNVGDNVEITFVNGPVVQGTVERIAIRSTQVRSSDGKLNFINNGSILRVANGSRDWSLAMVEMTVPAEWNVARSRQAAQQVCQQLAGSEVAELLLAAPEVGGVSEVNADGVSGMEIRCRTRPGQQAAVEAKMRALIARQIEEGR